MFLFYFLYAKTGFAQVERNDEIFSFKLLKLVLLINVINSNYNFCILSNGKQPAKTTSTYYGRYLN